MPTVHCLLRFLQIGEPHCGRSGQRAGSTRGDPGTRTRVWTTDKEETGRQEIRCRAINCIYQNVSPSSCPGACITHFFCFLYLMRHQWEPVDLRLFQGLPANSEIVCFQCNTTQSGAYPHWVLHQLQGTIHLSFTHPRVGTTI